MSVLDLLPELEGVGKPDGDPALVRQAAQQLVGLADGLERAVGGMDRGVAQALASWEGRASERFAATAGELAGLVRQAAGVLREAAAATNVYAGRLEAAQARWQQARGGAILGRALRLSELLDPDIRRAVAEAEAAEVDARAAAMGLAAALWRLANQAPPLPAGVSAPRHQDDGPGGWLLDWADRFPHDPLGAIGQAYREYYAGMGQTLRGYGEFAWLLVKAASPAYALIDHDGQLQAQQELATIVTAVGKLTTFYLMINPRAAVEAHQRFWSGLIGWDTLRTGNLPRWAGQLTPDVALAAATAGGGMAGGLATRGPSIARGARLTSQALPLANKDLRGSVRVSRQEALEQLRQEAADNGIFIHTDHEAQALLDWCARQHGTDPEDFHAVTLGEDIFVRPEYVDKVRVLREELLHVTQHRQGLSSTDRIVQNEIDARLEIIRRRHEWGITNEEVREMIREIRTMLRTGRY